MKGDKTVPCEVPVFIVLVVEKQCVGVEWFEVSLSCLLLLGDACDLDDDDGGGGGGGDGHDDDEDAAAAADDDDGSSVGCFLTQTVCVLLLRKSATQRLRWGQMFMFLSFCRRRCVCTVLNADEKSTKSILAYDPLLLMCECVSWMSVSTASSTPLFCLYANCNVSNSLFESSFNFLRTNFSRHFMSTEVSAIGLLSLRVDGRDLFGTGQIVAAFQLSGIWGRYHVEWRSWPDGRFHGPTVTWRRSLGLLGIMNVDDGHLTVGFRVIVGRRTVVAYPTPDRRPTVQVWVSKWRLLKVRLVFLINTSQNT